MKNSIKITLAILSIISLTLSAPVPVDTLTRYITYQSKDKFMASIKDRISEGFSDLSRFTGSKIDSFTLSAADGTITLEDVIFSSKPTADLTNASFSKLSNACEGEFALGGEITNINISANVVYTPTTGTAGNGTVTFKVKASNVIVNRQALTGEKNFDFNLVLSDAITIAIDGAFTYTGDNADIVSPAFTDPVNIQKVQDSVKPDFVNNFDLTKFENKKTIKLSGAQIPVADEDLGFDIYYNTKADCSQDYVTTKYRVRFSDSFKAEDESGIQFKSDVSDNQTFIAHSVLSEILSKKFNAIESFTAQKDTPKNGFFGYEVEGLSYLFTDIKRDYPSSTPFTLTCAEPATDIKKGKDNTNIYRISFKCYFAIGSFKRINFSGIIDSKIKGVTGDNLYSFNVSDPVIYDYAFDDTFNGLFAPENFSTMIHNMLTNYIDGKSNIGSLIIPTDYEKTSVEQGFLFYEKKTTPTETLEFLQ